MSKGNTQASQATLRVEAALDTLTLGEQPNHEHMNEVAQFIAGMIEATIQQINIEIKSTNPDSKYIVAKLRELFGYWEAVRLSKQRGTVIEPLEQMKPRLLELSRLAAAEVLNFLSEREDDEVLKLDFAIFERVK